jgi:hypothetical protein
MEVLIVNEINWSKYFKDEYYKLYIMFVRSDQRENNYSYTMGWLRGLRDLFCKLHINKFLSDNEFRVFCDIDDRIYFKVMYKFNKTGGVI